MSVFGFRVIHRRAVTSVDTTWTAVCIQGRLHGRLACFAYTFLTIRPGARPPDLIIQLVGEGRRRKYGGIDYREQLNGCTVAGEEG